MEITPWGPLMSSSPDLSRVEPNDSPFTPPSMLANRTTRDISLSDDNDSRTVVDSRWRTGFSTAGMAIHSLNVTTPPAKVETKRPPLGSSNHQPKQSFVPKALATPFLPGVTGGIWAQPTPIDTMKKQMDTKETQIKVLQEKLGSLQMEKDLLSSDNRRLNEENNELLSQLEKIRINPGSVSPWDIHGDGILPSSCHFLSMQGLVPGHLPNSCNNYGLTLQDQEAFPEPYTVSYLNDEEPPPMGPYQPPQGTIDLILGGKLDYSRLDPRYEIEFIRALIWTIAHQEPKSNAHTTALKIGANALGARLGMPRTMLDVQYLMDTIIEYSKPLCFTSNGNYLCQQLLEKGTSEDKISFIKAIEEDLVHIANSKFGAHVLVKAVGIKELESQIASALLKFGVFNSMETGARKIWRPYLTKCRDSNETEIFEKIMDDMKGRWSDLAVTNEHGSISVQQIFEGCANQSLIDACFKEILADISRVANNQFGHFVINKLLNYHEPFNKSVSSAILTSYPPVAANHHGVQFVEFAISSNRILHRANIIKYLEALCSQQEGRTPSIVSVANSSVGRGHLQNVFRQVPPTERALMNRVHNTCRQFQTTLRNSQSGNELLRSLGIISTPARRT